MSTSYDVVTLDPSFYGWYFTVHQDKVTVAFTTTTPLLIQEYFPLAERCTVYNTSYKEYGIQLDAVILTKEELDALQVLFTSIQKRIESAHKV